MALLTKQVEVKTGLKVTMGEDGDVSVALRATADYAPGAAVTHSIEVPTHLLPDGLQDLLRGLLEHHGGALLDGIDLKISLARTHAAAMGEL